MRSPRCGRLACGPVYFSRLPGTTRAALGDLAGCVNNLTDRPGESAIPAACEPNCPTTPGRASQVARRRGGRAEGRGGRRGRRCRLPARRAAAAEDPVRSARVSSPDGRAVREASAEPEPPDVGSQPVLGQPGRASGSGSKRRATSIGPRRCKPRAGACSRSWASTTPTAAAPTSRRSSRSSTPAPTSSWRASRASSRGRRTCRRCSAKQWQKFAEAYNGPAQAKNRYAPKIAAAYATFAAAPAGRSARRGQASAVKPKASACRRAAPSSRPCPRCGARVCTSATCGPTPSTCATGSIGRASRSRRPTTLWPNDPRQVKQQGETNACTGFALATVLEYLLERSRDQASRGHLGVHALQHGAPLRRVGRGGRDRGQRLVAARRAEGLGAARRELRALVDDAAHAAGAATYRADDWWLDAVKRPLGAYYRIAPDNVRDIHVALKEVGAVYASALTHEGWDDVLRDRKKRTRRKIPKQLPVIKAARGDADLGHAFAIVGYTRDGFIVHNSWGEAWGSGGFAVLPYEDWLRNAMDCWVVQLGVATVEHDEVAKAKSLRVERSGRAVVSSNETLADHEISPFVINMENEGVLSQRGRFRTNVGDLEALLANHIPSRRNAGASARATRWTSRSTRTAASPTRTRPPTRRAPGCRTSTREEERAPLRDTMARFVELGGKVMDTAMIYGTSEAVIGDLAQQLSIRDRLFLATKTDIRGQVRGETGLQNALTRLKTDRSTRCSCTTSSTSTPSCRSCASGSSRASFKYIGASISTHEPVRPDGALHARQRRRDRAVQLLDRRSARGGAAVADGCGPRHRRHAQRAVRRRARLRLRRRR